MKEAVEILFNEALEPGFYRAKWDARNMYGNEVPGGVYFCRVEAGAHTSVKKMILLR